MLFYSKFGKYGNQNAEPLNSTKPSSAFNTNNSLSGSAPTKPGNVFGSINLTKPETTKSGVFGSVNLTTTATTTKPKTTMTFGKDSSTSDDSVPLGIIKTPSSGNFGISVVKKTNDECSEPQSKIQKLNKSFMSWLDKQMINHSVSNWSAGLQDYVKYAAKISEEDAKKTMLASTKSSASQSSPSAETQKINKPTFPKFGGFSKSTTESVDKPANKTTVSSSIPKFGGFSKPAPSTSTSIDSTKTKGFSGFGGTNTTAKKGDSDEEYEGEPILEPEIIYKNENDKSTTFYETDCKSFRYDTEEKEWKDSGKGNVRLLQEPGEEKKKIVVRNTLGKITINAYIFKGMNFKLAGKSGMQFMAVIDPSGVPQSFLVKVRPGDIQATLETFSKAEQEAK